MSGASWVIVRRGRDLEPREVRVKGEMRDVRAVADREFGRVSHIGIVSIYVLEAGGVRTPVAYRKVGQHRWTFCNAKAHRR